MSPALISRSPDLQRLLDEGYEISIRANHLVVDNVPYVTPEATVAYGALVSELTLSGDRTQRPSTHVIEFTGAHFPCHRDGSRIEGIVHSSNRREIEPDLVVNHSFSNKPPSGYTDYFQKVDTYATIISGPAQSLDPRVTPKTFRPTAAPESSPFEYADTASSRAGISAATRRLKGHRIAIVGLGGTGVYVLDGVAKTPVEQIHLFDRDFFLTHNAFRAPGAVSLEELRERPTKVEHWTLTYSRMHRRIVPHAIAIDASNLQELRGFDFVFLCIDDGAAKLSIIEYLEKQESSFIDVGMGIELTDGALGGILRTTTSTPQKRDHFRERVPLGAPAEDDAYTSNIQIAELNMINAGMAIVKWKKLLGFYRDFEKEHCSLFVIDVNQLRNEDYE
ncbi:MAG: ThiF family adenylyltransferase [bacterium]|nr:ThiF family adenylyltransferase [bacterium]